MEIVLASGSPRRRELLERMGIRDFEVLPTDVDETLKTVSTPSRKVEILARRKADAAEKARPGALVIAADTVVALGGVILGKPADEADACRMLRALSGARHQVYTGVTVARKGRARTGHEVTSVDFRPLTQEEIRYYLSTGEWADKAGAYGIQGYGCLLVNGIHGDYYNVMGLPVARLARMLKPFGVDCLALAAKQEEEGGGRS